MSSTSVPFRRRAFLGSSAIAGLLTAAVLSLWKEDRGASSLTEMINPLAPRPPHFKPRAKNVIFLFMAGAPSQVDLLDPKPALNRMDGELIPESVLRSVRISAVHPAARIWGSPYRFAAHGQAGIELSDLLPQTAGVVDDLCLIRSMHTDTVIHHPAQHLLMSGVTRFGHPTMGAWITYGLGSEAQNLPGFVVLSSGQGTAAGANNWSNGFLPATYQGVTFRDGPEPVPYADNPRGISAPMQRDAIDAVRDMNLRHFAQEHDPEIAARIASYEMAFRMQSSAPELTDLSGETKQTRIDYGLDQSATHAFGTNCLLARRLVERGVRFVLVNHASWDAHYELKKNLERNCSATDRPAAALIADLKQRGLLADTIVIWGGEFGRTPTAELRLPGDQARAGRDHHANGFSMWLAGGGFRGGYVHGATDELGMQVAEEPVHIHDLQATLLQNLGLDHKRLIFRTQGRDFRLTDVGGKVINKLLA